MKSNHLSPSQVYIKRLHWRCSLTSKLSLEKKNLCYELKPITSFPNVSLKFIYKLGRLSKSRNMQHFGMFWCRWVTVDLPRKHICILTLKMSSWLNSTQTDRLNEAASFSREWTQFHILRYNKLRPNVPNYLYRRSVAKKRDAVQIWMVG